jgi:hypothetical protein
MQTMSEDLTMYDGGEVMRLLKISEATLRRRLREDDWRERMGAVKLCGQWRFVRASVDRVCRGQLHD